MVPKDIKKGGNFNFYKPYRFKKILPLERNGIKTKRGIKQYQDYFMQEKNNYLFGTAYGLEVGLATDISQRDYNQLIVGAAGTGKTYNYMLSNLRQANHSAVVLDYSNSLVNEQERFKHKGIKTHRIDFNKPESSGRYNPFLHAETELQILVLAENIIKYFDSGLTALTSGKILCSKDYEDPFYEKLRKLLVELAVTYVVKSPNLTDDERTFKTLYEVWNTLSDQSALTKFDITGKYSEVLSLIAPDAYAHVIKYIHQNFECVLSPAFECFEEKPYTDNTSVEKLGNELTYLFISGCPYPSTNKSDSFYYHSVCIDFLLSELINRLYKFAEDCIQNKSGYKSLNSAHFLPYHLHFYLDDFQYRNISNFLAILSTSRNYGMGFSIMIRDIAQLKSKYPNDEHLVVFANCDTQIFLGNLIEEDYKYFASDNYMNKSTLSEAQIRNDIIEQGKILVLMRDTAPMVCDRLNPNNYL